jgi:hypothetical protein
MSAILETVMEFFEEDAWPFTRVEDWPAVRTGFKGDSAEWICYAQAREEQAQCLFYSVCPINIPEEKRPAMAELLTRINYGLFIGNFEMDFSDGEVRYKTSIDVEGDRLSATLVKNMVYANVLTMDRYLPAVMSVIYSDTPPAQAVARVEDTPV